MPCSSRGTRATSTRSTTRSPPTSEPGRPMADQKKPGPLAIWLNPGGVVVLLAAAVTAALASMPIILVPGFLAYGLLAFLKYQAASAKDDDESAPIEPDTSAMHKPYAARVHRSVAI